MADSTWWWLIAGGAIALELMSGTVYLLLLGLGFAAAAIAAHAGFGLTAQVLVAAVVGVAAVATWYAVRRSRPAEAPSRSNRDVNLDIGQHLQIDAWNEDGTAVVRHRGAQWTAMQAAGHASATGMHRVVEVVGSRLVVEKI
jgi:membrane protein implicated in regulation of membrane protease activity